MVLVVVVSGDAAQRSFCPVFLDLLWETWLKVCFAEGMIFCLSTVKGSTAPALRLVLMERTAFARRDCILTSTDRPMVLIT